MTKKFLLLFLFVLPFVSCKKDGFDMEKQAELDEQAIKAYISQNNLQFQRHDSGIFYQIIQAGAGSQTYSPTTQIKTNYTGKLLNGQTFASALGGNTFTTYLGGVIAGWQIGVPLIQQGGKIRLLIPSRYAYGPNQNGSIPPNSVLDFEIDLLEVKN